MLPLAMGLPFAGRVPLDTWEGRYDTLLLGTVAGAAASFWYACQERTLRDAFRLLLLAFLLAWGAEILGAHTGFPFGARYAYQPAFRPHLPGGIPLAIPLAWYVLLRIPLTLLRRWPSESHSRCRALRKASACGLFMAACGYFLDPLGQAFGLWTFAARGPGLTASNALGWGLVGVVIVLAAQAGHRESDGRRLPAGMETIAVTVPALFMALAYGASFNRLGTALEPALALTTMALFWSAWWRSRQDMPACVGPASAIPPTEV